MALDYCNVRNITSFDENTKASMKCKMWYDTVRKSLLMNLNASFSIKRAILSEAVNYKLAYGYKKAFALPPDCLHVLNMDSPVNDKYYQIEGKYLLCQQSNDSPVQIKYIADIEDITSYDALFCDCFALHLAAKICYALTEDEQKVSVLTQLAKDRYIETSTKYGNDNRMIVINKPRYREAKINAEIENYNYPAL